MPTWAEFVVVIGVVSLGALAFMVLCRKLLGKGVVAEGEPSAAPTPGGVDAAV